MSIKVNLSRNLIGIFSCLVLAGCAAPRPPFIVDVSDSIYRGASPNRSLAHHISTLTIINKADDGTFVDTAFTSDSICPIKPQTRTRDTVEQDIKRYLEDQLLIDHSAKLALRVTIYKADSYFVITSARKTPFVGLATHSSDTDIGMNLKVLIEIEDSGKVVKSYLYDEKIVIYGKYADYDDIAASYRKLIDKYRKIFFGELDNQFINRYF